MVMNKKIFLPYILAASMGLFGASGALAADVNISPELASVDTLQDGSPVTIERIQDQNNLLTGGYTKTSRKCPPFCIQPIHVAPGVTTVGELELLHFIKDKVNSHKGLLIDARTPSWHEKGTIPGSINIPFTTFDEDADPQAKEDALGILGVFKKKDSSFFGDIMDSISNMVSGNDNAVDSPWNFEHAKEVLLWCNGMWCGQSPRAIKGLLALGYPPEKIFYYRGGMQSWKILGLTVVTPK
jgi:rhodanese-related sulfurtransferase